MDTLIKRQDKLMQALVSDEYTQGRHSLRTGDSFCCLGVACDLYAKETGIGNWRGGSIEGNPLEFVVRSGDYSTGYLPEEVRVYYGFKSRKGGSDHMADEDMLSSRNDRGASFKEIAELMRDHREEYFHTNEGHLG